MESGGVFRHEDYAKGAKLMVEGGKFEIKKAPKTRLGCVTCKARRVKCDETKPSCFRCLKFLGHCEGYPTSLPVIKRRRKASKSSNRGQIYRILPRPESEIVDEAHITFSTTGERFFSNEQEYWYFLLFKKKTVEELPGVFDGDLWNRIILQACHQEEFVRDAAVAIGALTCSGTEFVELSSRTKYNVTREKGTGPKTDTGSRHYQFALIQYGKAIRKMRHALEKGSLRMALISCLLVVCFEGLQGNFFQAVEHAVSGGKLLREWQDRQPYSKKAQEGIASPNELEIEDELFNAFGRLDLQLVSHVDTRQLEVHQKLKDEGTEIVCNMPKVFESVKEARKYWELIHRRVSHFSVVAEAESSQKRGPLLVRKMESDHRYDTEAYSINYDAERDVYKSLPVHLLPDTQGGYSYYSKEITRWFDAFNPFYETLCQHSRLWTAASLLYIHAKTTEITILSSFFEGECSLDISLPDHTEIVMLCRHILLDPLFRSLIELTFDQGLVNPVRLVSSWCRDAAVRREAIQILKERVPRQGLCDGLITAKSQEFIKNVEKGCKWGEFIPGNRRVMTMGVKIDCVRRIATTTVTRLGSDKDERANVIG